MKRIIIATLSTLVLSTLVSPDAHAIRPELLPQLVHPTVIAKESLSHTLAEGAEQPEQLAPSTQKMTVESLQPQPSDDPPFTYFEEKYRQKHGS